MSRKKITPLCFFYCLGMALARWNWFEVLIVISSILTIDSISYTGFSGYLMFSLDSGDV